MYRRKQKALKAQNSQSEKSLSMKELWQKKQNLLTENFW
jgi:hypothetical protein